MPPLTLTDEELVMLVRVVHESIGEVCGAPVTVAA